MHPSPTPNRTLVFALGVVGPVEDGDREGGGVGPAARILEEERLGDALVVAVVKVEELVRLVRDRVSVSVRGRVEGRGLGLRATG